MVRAVLIVAMCAWAGCDGCNNDGSRHIADAPHTFADALDASRADASDPNSEIFVTQTPPGPQNADPANWSGVLQLSVRGDFAPLVMETGVAKTELADPAGIAFRSTSSELFVGNRHGNNAADGVAGTVSRRRYTQGTHALVVEPDITGNGLSGVHQVTFSPTSGEMFAANFGGGVSRFTFDADGVPVANGMISDGTTRGVLVTPDGSRLFVTNANNRIRSFDLATGTEVGTTTLSSSGVLHYLAYRLGDVYVAALADNMVYRYHLAANDDLTYVQAIAAESPVGVAFSADGAEMFVTGHQTVDLLQRYTYDAATDTWMSSGTMDLGSSLGGVVIVPG
ncbi:MAG: WD40 repeat domain-containing protein [Deltaproteobacteria bacterium]